MKDKRTSIFRWGILVILVTSFLLNDIENKRKYRVEMEQKVGDAQKEYTI